jgi:D-sedoheptulose 7-phosphate isomerase
MDTTVSTTKQHIARYLGELQELLGRLPHDDISAVVEVLRSARQADRTVYVCGNGGSASTASHFAVDLGKTAIVSGQRRLRALALTDNIGLITAWANDCNFEDVFAEQVSSLIRPGDVLIAVSASGNSPNILKAVTVANERDAMTVGLTGFAGGRLASLARLSIVVPSDNMQYIEDVHLALNHLLVTCLRQID